MTDLHALRTEIQAVATAPKEGPTFSQGYGGKAPPPPAPPRSSPLLPANPLMLLRSARSAPAPASCRLKCNVLCFHAPSDGCAGCRSVQFGDADNQTTDTASGQRTDANFVPSKAYPLGSASEFLKAQEKK